MFLFSGAYWEYYLMGIILLPGIILAAYAQIKVTKTFNKYSKVTSTGNVTGAEFSRQILREADLEHIEVTKSNGTLTDHYNHKKGVIALSEGVYSSTSVASLGIAAHEIGHALQYKQGYFPVKLRSFLVPFTSVISSLLWPLVFLGIFLGFGTQSGGALGTIFVWGGITFFGLAVLFNLVTLPVEFDASRRAKRLLQDSGLVNAMQAKNAQKVLKAAALTYVAALIIAILNLLRFVLIVMGRSRD